jgi:hypothetical protein
MGWKCFFGCNIEWEKELKSVTFLQVNYVTYKEYDFVKMFHEGRCLRCGKIYRREVPIL